MNMRRRRRPHDELLELIESFFRDYLKRVRGVSRHTVLAYRDSLRLFFCFLAERDKCEIDHLRLEDITHDSVLLFLDHLQSARNNGIATRNSRLTAIRSLCRYMIRKDATHAVEYGRVISIRRKNAPKPIIAYLEPEEVKQVLSQPDRRTRLGVRDHSLIQFLYNTGARVSEALAIQVRDLELTRPWQVRVCGKGNKERLCPMWRSTARLVKGYIERWNLPAESRLFCNARRQPLTRSGVAYILEKHFETAQKKYPALGKRRLTPHLMRHSCAAALLQAGVDLVTIRDLLGHASVQSTNRYAKSNSRMKRRALEAFWKEVGLSRAREAHWKPTPELLELLSSL